MVIKLLASPFAAGVCRRGLGAGRLPGQGRRHPAADRLDGADHQEDLAGGRARHRAHQRRRRHQGLPGAVRPARRSGPADGRRRRRQVPGRGRAGAGLHRHHLLGRHRTDHHLGHGAVEGRADHLLLDREPVHAGRTQRRLLLPHHPHQQDPGLRDGLRDRAPRPQEDRGHLREHRFRHGHARASTSRRWPSSAARSRSRCRTTTTSRATAPRSRARSRRSPRACC